MNGFLVLQKRHYLKLNNVERDYIMRLFFKARSVLLCMSISILGFSLICFQSGCAAVVPGYADLNYPYTGDVENQLKDDSELNTKIQNMIAQNYFKSSAAVKVIIDHYNVLIVGEVDSQDTKNSISQLIKNQPSVKQYWDYTSVSAAAPVLSENTSINKKVQSRIASEDNITLDNLQTVTIGSVVYILGNVRTDELDNLNSAITGINSIDGVSKVINLTQIIPYQTPDV